MKRVLYILGVLAVGMLLVGVMLVAVLTSDAVETAAVRLATAELSQALGTHADVGAVEYRFPARLTIRDIYMEDRQGDTLLYAGELFAHFSPLALTNSEIRFSHVRLQDVSANIHRLPDSTWNYQFLADAFASEKKDGSGDPMRSLIAVKDVQFDRIRLRYEDYDVQVSHADMDLHALSADRLDAEISRLAMTVTRRPQPAVSVPPFTVNDLKAHVILTDSMLVVPAMQARLPQSRLDISDISLRLPFDNAALELPFRIRAELVPAEMSLFVPSLRGLRHPATFSGDVSGSVDSLSFGALTVRYNGRQLLQGDVAVTGLPDLSDPYLRANLTDLHTNAARVQDFLSAYYGRPIRLSQELHRLGNVHYRGLAQGRLHDLTLHGAFRTALGTISTDGTFRSDSAFEHMRYDARVVGRNFRLGRMLDTPKLTTVTLDLASKGQIDNGDVSGSVKAYVREFTCNGYTYADLHMDGQFEPRRYQGRLDIEDPHLDMAFDGVVNLKDKDPEINFNLRCRHFDTAPLQETRLSAVKAQVATSFALAVDMNGSKADNMSGYLVLDSLWLATPSDSAMMKQLTLLVAADDANNKAMTLRSDYLKADLDGVFRYADIVPAFRALAHRYLPALVDAPASRWQPVTFLLRMDGSHLAGVQRLFDAPVRLSDNPSLRLAASVTPSAADTVPLAFRFYAPGVQLDQTTLQDVTVTMGASAQQMELDVSVAADNMLTSLSARAYRDTLTTHLLFASSVEEGAQTEGKQPFKEWRRNVMASQRAGSYGGDLNMETYFSRYNRKPLVEMHCLPGIVTLRDSVYNLGESRLTYCAADTMLTVSRFLFEGAGQRIYADGVGSCHRSDTLAVELRKVDASYVVPFVLPRKTIMFNGLLTGNADIVSLFRRPQIETRIHIDSMGLNNCRFGDAEVDLHIADSLAFHAEVYRQSTKDNVQGTKERKTVVDLNGKALFDGSGAWELVMQTDSVPLRFINHWTQNVLTDLDGTATGSVVVGGSKKLGVYVLVDAEAQDAHLTLPWTGVRYTIAADTIVLDTTAIRFPHVHLADAEGHPVFLTGEIHHNQFRDFELDLHVDADNALVFGKDDPGEMLRGMVYASGHVDVTGAETDILVSANARTARNSRFRLSLDNASSAYESSFVHFKSAADTVLRLEEKDTARHTIETLRPERCLVKLNLDINPQLLFQLVLGERNGDMIQGRGTGALRLVYDTSTSDVSLLGTYDISQGTLSYTIANVIRKEFTVGEGAKIVFSGDPANPQLDVTAKYRVTANLRDLFGDEADQLSTSRSNIPVLTCLHLTGTLNSPVLSFALEFPMSDQNIQQQVQQIINTDEMLMRQVIYLLVFGRFFTPDYMSNAQYATLNSTYSLLSSTVTSQINAWLSKLTNILTLGVAIRTDGDGSDRSQEYEAQFQLQPVDRLVINGNVGYRYNDISNQPFFGDLDVEVLLTEDGQLRLKGYTHTVDKYSLRQASTIQGVGLVWKIDF